METIDLNEKTILITGVAGFIGSALVIKLLSEISDATIIGIDNMNDYYDVRLKQWRLMENEGASKKSLSNSYVFIKGDIADKNFIEKVFCEYRPEIVVNLAAQAGVRYSIENPDVYIQSNILGFYNILEACRHSYDNGRKGVCHLVYASSSSVYGANEKVPYSTEDKVDNPVSLYAATKKANELIAHAYSKLYNIPSTGLRFFTVYGPAGRPDMAYYSFAENIIKNVPIKVFNNEDMYRDFTYIDDIVEGIFLVMRKTPILNDEGIRYKIYNIGKGKPEKLSFLIKCLEEELGKTAIKEYYPMQPGDMYQTYADISGLINDFDYLPMVELRDGIHLFVKWFLEKEYSI